MIKTLLDSYQKIMPNSNNKKCNKRKKREVREEVQNLMRTSWSRYVIWEMDAGLIIISHLKSRLDSTDHQRLLLVQTIILQLISGVLPVLSLRWSQETSCLNQEKALTMTKMMII
jgi:hypothetical protein